MDETGKKLISGVRTLDNCYGLVLDVDIVCNSIRLPNKDLWHQRMGHASYKHFSIVSKHESVLGIPKLSRMSNVVYGPCQLRKQMKAKHPDDFTRYTWVILLRSKSDAPKHIKALCTRLQNEKSLKINRI
nr:hypothetical protein CFP56_13708 [Quercus suber]